MIRNDVSWSDYLAIKRMNPSTLVHGRKSMLHLKQALEGGAHEDSPALNFGRVFHSVTLKQGTHAVIPDFHLDEGNVTQTGKRSKSKGTTYYETTLAEWMSRMSGQYDICTREQLEEAEQQMQLFRVTDRIGELVVEFFNTVTIGGTFHAENLRAFVDGHCKSAPGSADRVMRSLRKQGLINYTVVNRKSSLYRRELVKELGSVE